MIPLEVDEALIFGNTDRSAMEAARFINIFYDDLVIESSANRSNRPIVKSFAHERNGLTLVLLIFQILL